MKCQGKQIKVDDPQDCQAEATGMFRTIRGVIPLCQDHATFAKINKLLVRVRDNFFG